MCNWPGSRRAGLPRFLRKKHKKVTVQTPASSAGRPKCIQGRNPGTCCTCCVTKDYRELSASSRNQITCASGRARVDWNGALFSSVMTVGSVCMRVMDIHVYCIDLLSIIFRSAFVHDTQSLLRLHSVGGHQSQLMVISGVSAG